MKCQRVVPKLLVTFAIKETKLKESVSNQKQNKRQIICQGIASSNFHFP